MNINVKVGFMLAGAISAIPVYKSNIVSTLGQSQRRRGLVISAVVSTPRSPPRSPPRYSDLRRGFRRGRRRGLLSSLIVSAAAFSAVSSRWIKRWSSVVNGGPREKPALIQLIVSAGNLQSIHY